MSYCAVVLAAGNGTRMKSSMPKVMCEVLGEPMLGWVLDSVGDAGIPAENTGVVVGSGADIVKAYLGKRGSYPTFMQTERKGTGHAVMQAEEMLGKGDNVLILCGDAPFIDSETIIKSLNEHIHSGSDVTVVTAMLDDPAGYGRINRGENGELLGIIEKKDCTPDQLLIKEINSGVYWFKSEALRKALPKLSTANASGEYYLTDTISAIREEGGKAAAFTAENSDIILGANSRRDLLTLNNIARFAVIDKHLDNGVEFVCTDGVIIGKDVVIGRDTRIMAGTILRGKTEIGEKCVIGPNSVIEDCVVGNSVTLNNVHAFESKVGDGSSVGPFAQLRKGTVLHEGVKIGDFVEIKNSEIGKKTSVAHLTYLGDSDIGKDVNFGCGCVTANYDGVNKFRTTIGDHAFIGCNTNLIAPVTIGENAATAAGVTITKHNTVPADSLAVGNRDVTIIENWEHNSKRIRKA